MATYFIDFSVTPQIYYEHAKNFYEKCKEAKDSQNEMIFAVLSITLSILVIEAYINGYAAQYVYDEQRKPDNASCEAVVLDFLLDSQGNIPLDTKLLIWTKIITGKTFDKTEEPWGTYKYIRKLRDKIIHFKQQEADMKKVTIFQVGNIDNNIQFWESKIYENINKENAEKAIKCVTNIIEKLTAFRGWPRPEWLHK